MRCCMRCMSSRLWMFSSRSSNRCSSMRVRRRTRRSAWATVSNSSRPQMQVPGGQGFRMGGVFVMATDYGELWGACRPLMRRVGHRTSDVSGVSSTDANSMTALLSPRYLQQVSRNIAAIDCQLVQHAFMQPDIHLCRVSHLLGRAAELCRQLLACAEAAV
jgi:hypothetical protein